MEILLGRSLARSVSVAAELALADRLARGAVTVSDLAVSAGVHEEALYRLLRALAAFGIFRELDGRRFENSELSEPLRGDHPGSLRAQAEWIDGPLCWGAWGRLDHSVRTGRPAFDEVFGMPWFEYLEQSAPDRERFDAAMGAATRGTARAVAEAYDYSGVETLVDVGGGRGDLLAAILERHPSVGGVLMDRPEVVRRASARLGELAGRVSLVPGDFFEEVPPGGDLYVVKQVLHDWSDELCLEILGNCRAAMSDGARLLIVERTISETRESRWSKLRDLDLLAITGGGRERDEEEYVALLERAGLERVRVLPTTTQVGILEARLRGAGPAAG
ncbi:MAG: methyltransferase [Thermoanaerobaculia bacterium]|nr:methyltransferase [Thermoanaerobaculia bacterium]